MATEVPAVATGDPLSAAWADIVQTAMAEVRTLGRKMGPVACTVGLSGWANYGGIYADAQVVRLGDFVIFEGLVRNNSGAAAALPINNFVTIPAGYRPRAVESGAPLGGALLFATHGSFANYTARIDVSANGTGSVSIGTSTGAVTLPNGGFITLNGMWHGETLADETSGMLEAAAGGDLQYDWFNSVFWIMTALQDNLAVSGPVALNLVSIYEPYGGGWADPQVFRMGPLVVCSGLVKLKSGSMANTFPAPIATIPSGYRPRPTGSASPLGGRIITLQRYSSSNATPVENYCRVDITDAGDIIVQSAASGTSLTNWVALMAVWIGE